MSISISMSMSISISISMSMSMSISISTSTLVADAADLLEHGVELGGELGADGVHALVALRVAINKYNNNNNNNYYT
jgi:hypothetical protein